MREDDQNIRLLADERLYLRDLGGVLTRGMRCASVDSTDPETQSLLESLVAASTRPGQAD